MARLAGRGKRSPILFHFKRLQYYIPIFFGDPLRLISKHLLSLFNGKVMVDVDLRVVILFIQVRESAQHSTVEEIASCADIQI